MNAPLAAATAALCLCLPCGAQTHGPMHTRPAAADTVPQRGGEPAVQRIVTEDDTVRVEELRVRGQTRRIVVQSKLPGVPAYEIGPAADARAPAQARDSEGRSKWQLLSF